MPEQDWFKSTRSTPIVMALLIAIMLMGGYFRFIGQKWDDFVRFHPDERYLAGVASSLGGSLTVDQSALNIWEECLERNPDTNGRGGYFDTDCSPFHPENVVFPHYVYGTLPLFMVRAAGEIANDVNTFYIQQIEGEVGSQPVTKWLSYNGIFQVWRTMSALADMVVIGFVFLIGGRLHGKWVGLLAALLYAAAVTPIQQSHFGTADAITNLFVTMSMYFAVRTMDTGSWWDYGLFGVVFGMSVASRVNVVPLAGIIIVVAIIQALPAFDSKLAWNQRNRIITWHLGGLVLAGVLSILAFRVFQPYAFQGPGFFGLLPDERYLDTLGQAQFSVSGNMDTPPNWQWVNRHGYLFPWQNMVLWGMGIALGLTAWGAWVWATWRILQGHLGALRNAPLIVWIGGYFAWAGNLWVMSMRYYLPLYPVLVVLAAWALIELVKRTNREHAAAWARYGARGLLVGVAGFTVVWAVMFTNIYRHMATFTQASHWVWENLPGDFYMEFDDATEDDPLINLPLGNGFVPESTEIQDLLVTQATRLEPGLHTSTQFTPHRSGTVSTIYANRLVDPENSGEIKVLELTITNDNTTDQVLATATLSGEFGDDEHFLGSSYSAELDQPLELEGGKSYWLHVDVVEGETLLSSGAILSVQIDWEEVMPAKVCDLPGTMTLASAPPSGLNTIEDCNGRSAWNGLINGHKIYSHFEDVEFKRDQLQVILDETDYVMIPTNRRYDSQARIPSRWPMTNRYFEALFDGELGFELVALFNESFELGPLKVSDQHLPIYDSPSWLNELEAEEAFHVYDHPAVFVFRKTDDYSPANTWMILNRETLTRVDSVFPSYNDPTLTNVMALSSLQADEMPTQLQFNEGVARIQRSGGTWSSRFDWNSFINENQAVAVGLWWVTIGVIGWVAWPLLFVTFSALADRGYSFAKFTGMLLVGWIAWYLSSLRIPFWSQAGISLILLILACISLLVVLRNRRKMVVYLASRWRLIAFIEVVSLMLYLAFVGIRMTNPDLWHSHFGGEKPMDFAYFNAVLRSTVFPPIDPWFAGGYINYYYFGYVIVGVPTLLLGIVPSLAYNLIVPTLFSATGIATFSVAFSVVNGWRTRLNPSIDETQEMEAERSLAAPKHRTVGNPWVAGIVALLLAVILGNLDTPRVFANGLANLGGYEQASSYQDYLYNGYLEEAIDNYRSEFGVNPPQVQHAELMVQAQVQTNSDSSSSIFDRIRYSLNYPISVINGIGKALKGDQVYIPPNRWFWAATRVIAEIPNSGDGAINEMPFFTFLYGDLHAHMIAMPMMVFAVAFVYNELMTTGRDRRSRITRWGALFFGALVVGMFQATNTWDFPTFAVLSVMGLGYAWWLSWQKVTRWSLLSLFGRMGGFLVMVLLVATPYTMWFASGLTVFKVWEGNKTPIWAYITIHGAFLFLLVSLLVWETARWLASVKVSSLRGRMYILYTVLLSAAVVILAGLVLMVMGYRVAIIVVPLIGWIALLFFRPNQARSMQFVLVLAGLALAITMGTEIITLAYDNGRQNTIFKFYIQVWLLFSVVGGAAFAWSMSNSFMWRARLTIPWYLFAGILFFVTGLYPIQATRGRAFYRLAPETPTTLNGMDYMQYTVYSESGAIMSFDMNDDYNVIRWLQDNVEGSPVIMEAQSEVSVYQWGGRISNNTGLPSVVGWDYHQRQQRSLEQLPTLVDQRRANVNAFYTTHEPVEAAEILRHYGVEYVIVTSYEKARYGETGGLDKLDDMVGSEMLSIVYEEGDATIYQVNQSMLEAVAIARSDFNKR